MPTVQKSDQDRHPEKYFSSPKGHIRDRIIIHESADMPKNGRTFGLNGYLFLAKPGKEIDIPRPVRLMLDTCIVTESNHEEGDAKDTRDIPRVTYTLVKEGVNLDENGKVIDDYQGVGGI
jgi:hypothetical protein